ncbi:cytidine deaminase-like fold-containing protein [Pseudomonas huanghezhanensis]|uniref:cytidine deaminase-like fold-containing protein n=1 Tax=Pseudomonas huanghezhanensis TaxID=3002903 RepID=UPI0022860E72|nr:hypothetical protein [Pseudomonas sp. BSw22131]
MAQAHAEIGVIQQAYEVGMTQGKHMTMTVEGRKVCDYCLSNVRSMAKAAGLESITIYQRALDSTLYWDKGMPKLVTVSK